MHKIWYITNINCPHPVQSSLVPPRSVVMEASFLNSLHRRHELIIADTHRITVNRGPSSFQQRSFSQLSGCREICDSRRTLQGWPSVFFLEPRQATRLCRGGCFWKCQPVPDVYELYSTVPPISIPHRRLPDTSFRDLFSTMVKKPFPFHFPLKALLKNWSRRNEMSTFSIKSLIIYSFSFACSKAYPLQLFFGSSQLYGKHSDRRTSPG